MEIAAGSRIGQFKVPVELRPEQSLFTFRIEALAAPPQFAVLLVGPRNDGDSVDGIPLRRVIQTQARMPRPTAFRLGSRISSYSRDTTMPSAPASKALRTH
jgi:hypothetical protein